MRWLMAAIVGLGLGGGLSLDARADARLLVFSKTAGYRHASIPDAIAALESAADERGWTIVATEDAAVFTDGTLAEIDVAVFLMNTGDVLDATQQDGLRAFVEDGHGFVGIHSVSNAETEWPWFGELLGTRFADHPAQQDATMHVMMPTHPACAGLPDPWVRFDEWYNFTTSPSATVDVLLQLDETSYTGGTMGRDHPIAWTHVVSGARVFYTAPGHTAEAWADPTWLGHVTGGIAWVIEGEPTSGESSGGTSTSGSGSGSATNESSVGDSGAGQLDSGDAEVTSTGPSATAGDHADDCACGRGRGPSLLLLLLVFVWTRARAS